MSRATWDQYFLEIAKTVATRATCDRKHVGAIIVRDKIILSTGYNGSIRGLPHCDEIGHLMEDSHCTRTAHAESNAVAQAARAGTRIDGAELYVTASPCWPCFKLVANAGIKRIVFGEFYRDERIFDAAKALEIELVDANDPEVSRCHICSMAIMKGTRFCEPHLALEFARAFGRDVPNEDDRAKARKIFADQEAKT
jgi:dCMP deaminase